MLSYKSRHFTTFLVEGLLPMRRFTALMGALVVMVLVAACDSLPGLRVLRGEDDPQTIADAAVEAGGLVMADKSGGADPSVSAAADRIEAASGFIDIVEMRQNRDSGIFTVDMLFNPPTGEGQQGQIALLDALRRAFEVTWLGSMQASQGSEVIAVRLLFPQSVTTLESGPSYIGYVFAQGEIERASAQAYLQGERSLNTFFDLIADGTLVYEEPDDLVLYEGSPNHPLFMLPGPA